MKKYQQALSLSGLVLCAALVFSQLLSVPESYAGILRDRLRQRIEKIREKKEARKEDAASVWKEAGKDVSGPGNFKFFLMENGTKRKYLLHVPDSYDKNAAPVPLVLAFHGGGGSAEMMADDEYYHLISKSDMEGFIIAFPNGSGKLRSGKLATWNAGSCCGHARDNNIDDVGFVKDIIADVSSRFNVDGKKVYAAGFSNGGMLVYRLACEMPDKLKAIASVSGTDNYYDRMPEIPVSVLHIHAKDDGHVLFNGGAGPDAFRDKSKVTDFTSVPDTISKWVKADGCVAPPERILDNEDVYCDLYTGGGNNTEVKLFVTRTGGHSWPGGGKNRKAGDTPSNAISATDEIWNFFKDK